MPEYLPAFERPASASSAAGAEYFRGFRAVLAPAVYGLRSVAFHPVRLILAAISDVGFSGDTCRSPGHEEGAGFDP
jgi:hypothetical protein